jgi:endothelin-converting enzyme
VAIQKSVDEENFDKMKAAYDACLNEDEIKNAGLEPLLKALDEIKQMYPVNTAAAPDTHALKDAILLLAKYGVSALVSSGTGADDTDPDTVVVSVSPPWSFGLPSKERYDDEKLVEKYRSVAVEVLSALYPDQDKDAFAKIVDLEKRLAAASPSTEERDDVTHYYNPMLIDEAAAIAPEIELEALLHGLAPANSKIERVIVMAPKYMKELSIILAATDKEVLQSYFIWKAVQSYAPYIDADAVKPYKRFRNVLAGKVSEQNMPSRCKLIVAGS